ncbi:hypothetical protein FQN57_005334 [Myotisia sp. PD_48]|nr:hypothetical protein FQN57_005334 [Myotisia sp. PD_48]
MEYQGNIPQYAISSREDEPLFYPQRGNATFPFRSASLLNRDREFHGISDSPWPTESRNTRIAPGWDVPFRETREPSVPLEQPGHSRSLAGFTSRSKITTPPSTFDHYPCPPVSMVLEPIGEPLRLSPVNMRDPFTSFHSHQISDPGISYPMESDQSIARAKKPNTVRANSVPKFHLRRRPGNKDEFDGPTQLLRMPSPGTVEIQERDLPPLPTSLNTQEQSKILGDINDRLSKCAFDFVAKYQFPIPLESDKDEVKAPQDREWAEWVHLLRRLATKRRIPARVLYDGQIKQFITVLENSLEMRHLAKNQSRPLRDDRHVLQLISAGTQVAKILKDAPAMEFFDILYSRTEKHIRERQSRTPSFAR